MKDKLLKDAQDRLSHLTEWLRRIKTAQEQVSDVQDMVVRTEWEISMLTDLPEEAEEFVSPGLTQKYTQGNEYLYSFLPLPPEYEKTKITSSGSITTSGTSTMVSFVRAAGETKSPLVQYWSNSYVVSYRDIQEKQLRFEKTQQRLQILSTDGVIELEKAQQAYSAAAAEIGERVAAGIAMRNMLEHFKGDLWEKARNNPRENMTWEKMAERLTVGDSGGIEHQELLDQEREWKSLHSRLTEVAKDQKKGLVVDLDDIWTRLIDHLFTILGIIKI